MRSGESEGEVGKEDWRESRIHHRQRCFPLEWLSPNVISEEVTKNLLCQYVFPKLTVAVQESRKTDPILHLHLILLFFLNFNSCY